MPKKFTDRDEAAAYIMAHRGIDPRVILGPVIDAGEVHWFGALIGTHKNTAESLVISTADESAREKLVETLVKGRMSVQVFEREPDMLACAAALWPATASLR